MTDSGASERAPDVDEVFRRIGRNLVLFQQIEHLLKHLLAHAQFDGTPANAEMRLDVRRQAIYSQTMGQLAGRFTDEVLSQPGEALPDDLDTDDSPEARFGFRFTIQLPEQSLDDYKTDLKRIVDSRNDLIHHFLPKWDPTSAQSTQTVLLYLDKQQANALPLRDRLKVYIQTLREATSLITSDEYQRLIEVSWLRHSRLVRLLAWACVHRKRPDGWLDLAQAGHILRTQAPDDWQHMSERYGHRTLKSLLMASELFEICDEPTPRGGRRTVYRLDPTIAVDDDFFQDEA